jgi:hypothetical protein
VVRSVAFSPDVRQVLSDSSDKTLNLWDAASGALLRTFDGHSNQVWSVAFSSDGRQLLSGSWDGTIRVWSAETGAALVSFLATPEGEWLAITPEGFFAASSKGAEMLSVVRGLEAFSIDQFYQALYRPDLVEEKLAGDPTGKVEAAAKLDLTKLIESGRVPAVKFISHQAEQTSATDLVIVEAGLADQGGGLGRAEWRINGWQWPDRAGRAGAACRRRIVRRCQATGLASASDQGSAWPPRVATSGTLRRFSTTSSSW